MHGRTFLAQTCNCSSLPRLCLWGEQPAHHQGTHRPATSGMMSGSLLYSRCTEMFITSHNTDALPSCSSAVTPG